MEGERERRERKGDPPRALARFQDAVRGLLVLRILSLSLHAFLSVPLSLLFSLSLFLSVPLSLLFFSLSLSLYLCLSLSPFFRFEICVCP